MERGLTLRLSDEEYTALEEMKKIGNEKTYSKIIKYVIIRFKGVSDELRNEIEKNRKLRAELDELKRNVQEFTQAFRLLNEVK